MDSIKSKVSAPPPQKITRAQITQMKEKTVKPEIVKPVVRLIYFFIYTFFMLCPYLCPLSQ